MAIDEYSVGKITRTCGRSGRALEPDEVCIATLCENAEGQLERVDFAEEAWSDDDRPEGFFSKWKTTVPADDGPRRAFVDDAALLDIFARLDGDERRDRMAFRYVLALVLLRKRLLKFEGRCDSDEGDVWLLRPRGEDAGPPMEVVDPGLDDEAIVAVNEQLGEILHGSLG
ncbi:MAG: hypothetical protein MK074_00790 [Phycisphaerales bacterium]|nr:hypothetical protein [Phycisphaerales bacterium]